MITIQLAAGLAAAATYQSVWASSNLADDEVPASVAIAADGNDHYFLYEIFDTADDSMVQDTTRMYYRLHDGTSFGTEYEVSDTLETVADGHYVFSAAAPAGGPYLHATMLRIETPCTPDKPVIEERRIHRSTGAVLTPFDVDDDGVTN